MALAGKWNVGGFDIDAYLKVHRIFGGKSEGYGSVVRVYKSKAAAAAEPDQFAAEFNGPVAPYADGNPIALAYVAMKGATIPDVVPDPDAEEAGATKVVQIADPRFAALQDA